MLAVSAGPCPGSQVGVVTLVDRHRRRRLFLCTTAGEALEVARALERGPSSAPAVHGGARTVAVHLIDRAGDTPTGVVLTADKTGQRRRVCPPVVAVLRAIDEGLPLWIPDPLFERWGVPIRAARSAADTVPPVFRRFIAEELPTADAL
jgi:hypothetical protein